MGPSYDPKALGASMTANTQRPAATTAPRKAYKKPTLQVLGDFRSLTRSGMNQQQMDYYQPTLMVS